MIGSVLKDDVGMIILILVDTALIFIHGMFIFKSAHELHRRLSPLFIKACSEHRVQIGIKQFVKAAL